MVSGGIVSLCTGFGALDHAVQEVFGGEVVAVADTDRASSTLLAHHHPEVPNLGDITAVDWAPFAGADWLTSGWPCQPWSVGGLRKGELDERAIWPAVARAIRGVRPRHVLLENVPAIAAAGELARAVGDLAAIGYVGSWRCVSAASVGAPHLRERIFVVATDTDGIELREQPVAERGRRGSTESRQPREAVSDAEGERRDQGRSEPARVVRRSDAALGSDGAPADTPCLGHDGPRRARDGWDGPADGGVPTAWVGADGTNYGPAIQRWGRVLGRPAPSPTVLGPKGGPVLSPYFDEWLIGAPEGWITSVPGLSRADMVKLCGNGVVRQAAVAALRAYFAEVDARAVVAA